MNPLDLTSLDDASDMDDLATAIGLLVSERSPQSTVDDVRNSGSVIDGFARLEQSRLIDDLRVEALRVVSEAFGESKLVVGHTAITRLLEGKRRREREGKRSGTYGPFAEGAALLTALLPDEQLGDVSTKKNIVSVKNLGDRTFQQDLVRPPLITLVFEREIKLDLDPNSQAGISDYYARQAVQKGLRVVIVIGDEDRLVRFYYLADDPLARALAIGAHDVWPLSEPGTITPVSRPDHTARGPWVFLAEDLRGSGVVELKPDNEDLMRPITSGDAVLIATAASPDQYIAVGRVRWVERRSNGSWQISLDRWETLPPAGEDAGVATP